MNHLRELQDHLSKDRVLCFEDAIVNGGVQAYRRGLRYAQLAADQAVCFWMGHVEDVIGLQLIDELSSRLPYPVCWFEMSANAPSTGKQCVFGLLATQTDGGTFTGVAFMRRDSLWAWEGSFQLDPATNGLRFDGSRSDTVRVAVRCFLSALNCRNVRRFETRPDVALQAARKRRGKKPLFSFWSLELTAADAGASRGAGTNGERASPRVHLRRGHARRSHHNPGSWEWVQPCVVGNSKLGMVHKDYDGQRIAETA
jgi:hypothetical protein